jgi:hypothetical protein
MPGEITQNNLPVNLLPKTKRNFPHRRFPASFTALAFLFYLTIKIR